VRKVMRPIYIEMGIIPGDEQATEAAEHTLSGS
jgi:hypothetical protein